MKNELHTKLNAALQDIDWHGEDKVLQMIRQQPQKIRPLFPSRALVFAIILILTMATTAVALTLHFSGFFNEKLQAKQAVQAKYGLTEEMIDLFTYESADGADGVVAIFTMDIAYGEKLGVYTVYRTAGGKLDVSWSHDGADQSLLDSGSLASPAWGAKQLERILHLYRERAAQWINVLDYDALTLQEKAALDSPLLEVQELGVLIHIEPDQSDLSVEDAEKIARKAIADKYGVTEEVLSGDSAAVSFFLYGGTQRREYRFDLNHYVVYVASPSGEVTYCRWLVSEKDRTLPEGNLSNYPDAAEEYIASGAFDLLATEDKAAVINRYAQAGLDHLLLQNDFVSPSTEKVKEQDACALAFDTLTTAYDFPDGWETLFTARASMINGDTWVIEYMPHELSNWHWRDFGKLGVYTVAIHAVTGRVISCDWSLQEMQTDGYTEHKFAAAPAFSADMLPWVLELLTDLQNILDGYPQQYNLDDMSLEDRGEYDTRMREAGYPLRQYPSLIPQDSDMPQEEAAALAWDALNMVYDLSDMALDRGEASQEGLYLIQQPDGSLMRVWNIVYTNNMDIFTIHVNTETREIENIWHDNPAFGNG